MNYFNDNNDFHPTFTAEEPETYLFVGQTSAIEDANNDAYETFANRWGMAGPAPMVNSHPNPRATASYGEGCDRPRMD